MFVDQRDFPGGPGAFYIAEYSTPPKILANVAFVLLVWVNMALIVCLLSVSACREVVNLLITRRSIGALRFTASQNGRSSFNHLCIWLV